MPIVFKDVKTVVAFSFTMSCIQHMRYMLWSKKSALAAEDHKEYLIFLGYAKNADGDIFSSSTFRIFGDPDKGSYPFILFKLMDSLPDDAIVTFSAYRDHTNEQGWFIVPESLNYEFPKQKEAANEQN